MAFKKLVSPSLTEMFVDEIKKMILSGELKTDTKLPTERKLAEEMDVSLAVVHEGITRLTNLGLLRVVPRHGVYVADYIRIGDMNTLREIFEYQGPDFTPENQEFWKSIATFRKNIEQIAVKNACMHRTKEHLARMKQLLVDAEQSDNESALPEICFSYYHEITIASGNDYIPLISQTFRPMYLMFFLLEQKNGAIQVQVENMKALYQSIEKQDIASSVKYIDISIDSWLNSMISQ